MHLESELSILINKYVINNVIAPDSLSNQFFFSSKLKATGQEVFQRVCELLGVKELHYFGLTLVKSKN